MLVALKFCGGCDPAYERVEYWQAIERAAGRGVAWTRLEQGPYDAVLLICGCARACIEHEMPSEVPLLCLKDETATPEEVIARLLKRGR
jgi:hypothetical protein